MKGKGKVIRIVVLLLLLTCFGVSAYMLIGYYSEANKTENSMNDLRDALPSATPRPSPTAKPATPPEDTPEPTERVWEIDERFEALYEQNGEIVGWITIDGTNIDYPVMQSSEDDPEKYLHTSFDGSYDVNGVPFLDHRCELTPNSQNMIVYGHNMKSKIMFHYLTGYETEEFWQEHKYVIFDTIYDEGIYEVAAAYIFAPEGNNEENFRFHRYADFPTEEDFDEYLAEVEDRKLYDTGVEIEWGDELLTLATCEYSNYNGRFVVLAKKVG